MGCGTPSPACSTASRRLNAPRTSDTAAMHSQSDKGLTPKLTRVATRQRGMAHATRVAERNGVCSQTIPAGSGAHRHRVGNFTADSISKPPGGRRSDAGGRPDARLPPPNACHCPGLVQSALARGRHTLGLYPLPPPSRFALLPAQLWPASDQRPMHKVSLLMKVCSCFGPESSALATQAWGDLRGADFIGLALPSCGDE
ncbi:MAG: hypothetical protein JWO24_819 [Rhodospirillales bacterium]|nr:hypothetical protein [Rhodospirillales bacterium]